MDFLEGEHSVQPSQLRERVLGFLLVAGSVVALTTVLLPTRADGSEVAVVACGLFSLCAGGLLIALAEQRRRLPTWALGLGALMGTVLIVAGSVAGGFKEVGAADSQLLFIWVCIYAFYFFSLRHALLQLAPMAIGLVILLDQGGAGQEGGTRFLVAITTLLVVGLLVRHLRERAYASIAIAEDRARRDELTGCLNRRGLQERASAEFNRALREGTPVGFILIDLDQFKMFNEVQGQAAGDELLTHVASSIVDSTRGVDAVARLGADEFGVLLPGAAAADVEEVAGRLIADLNNSWGRGPALTTMSVGACSSRIDTQTLGDLWRSASRALDVAQATGGDQARLARDPAGRAVPVG